MKYVRIALGVLVALYSVMGLWHMVLTIGHKTGVYVATDAMTARMVPLMEAIAWWQVAVWLAAVAAMLVAAWRLVRGGQAFKPYAVGFVLDVGGWLTIQGSDAYRSVFTAAERQFDYYILAGLVVIGLVIWWSERANAPAAAAA